MIDREGAKRLFGFTLEMTVRVQADSEEQARGIVDAVLGRGEVVPGVEITMAVTRRVDELGG